MADGNTPTYSLILPEIDGADGTWGVSLNTNLGSLDSLLSGGTALTAISVTGTVTAGGVTLGDNEKIQLGASQDLELFHDGTNSYVQDDGDGGLILNTTGGNGVFIHSATETMGAFHTNGAVNLYHDNAEKFATTATGIDVTGTVTASEGVLIPESKKLILGSETDTAGLEIYEASDGDSLIKQYGDGNLIIKGQNILLRNNSDQTLMSTILNTAQLFHRNGDNEGLKLETTNSGISVTGDVAATTVTVGDSTGTNLELYEDSSQNAIIRQRGTGSLQITGINGSLSNDDYEQLLTWGSDAINLSWQGLTAAGTKLSTTETGISVTGTVAASDGLTADYIDLTGGKSTTTTGAICADQIRFSAENSDEAKIYASVDGLNTSLFIQSADDEADKVRVVAGGTESLTVSRTGIDVTGTVEADEFSGTGTVAITDFIDDDTFATASATNVPTAESVKAYVDAGGGGGGETLAQTLALGASTGGTDLSVSAGDDIVFSDTSKAIFQDEDGDPKLEIYSNAGESNNSTITSTGVSLYLEATDDTLTPHINLNADGNQYFRTSFSSSSAQLTLDGSAGTTVRGSLIQEATNSYTGSISARTANITGGSAIPVIDCYHNVSTSNGDTIGALKYFGENSSGEKSYYGEMSCIASNTSAGGNQIGRFYWYVADGSGQTVPVTNVNADNAGKQLAMVVSNTFTGFYGGNQLFLTGTNFSGDKGYFNFQNNQSLRPPLTSDSSKIYLPQTSGDKVMSVGGIGTADSWIFGTTMSETDFLKYRGQHMVRYGMTATATSTFDLPKVQSANGGQSSTLGNIGDIYTISNTVGGALTIDRDASGTAQAVYELNGSSLVTFTNNPTISEGGSITLQAVGENTYLIMNAKGLTDA